jgi:hypothetical protein
MRNKRKANKNKKWNRDKKKKRGNTYTFQVPSSLQEFGRGYLREQQSYV